MLQAASLRLTAVFVQNRYKVMAQDGKTLKRANKGFNSDIMLFNQNYPLQLNKVCCSGSVCRHSLDALLMLQQAQGSSLIRTADLGLEAA